MSLGTCDIHTGDALTVLRSMPDESVQCCVTSPPYWGLRDYGVAGQLGLERTPDEYVAGMVAVFREVRRVLKDDGTLWLNIGDSYASAWSCSRRSVVGQAAPTKEQRHRRIVRGSGSGRWGGGNNGAPGLKEKDLIGIPWRVAFALQNDGWYLRSDIIWSKPNCMPEPVTDRPTKAHEYLFLLSKRPKYYYDSLTVKERSVSNHNSGNGFRRPEQISRNGRGNEKQWQCASKRNRRTVWTVHTKQFKAAHFATFPPKLIEPCILAGCPPEGTVLDPFNGAGTTGLVALSNGRNYVGIELNPEYVRLTHERLEPIIGGLFATPQTRHAGEE